MKPDQNKEYIVYDFVYANSRKCKLVNSDKQQLVVAWGQGWRKRGGRITKRPKETT